MLADDPSIARRLALLKSLEGTGIRRASELPPPESKLQRGPAPLTQLFPKAEKLGEAGGATLWRIVSEIPADGTQTRQGYSCPAAAWGGPPVVAEIAHLTGEPAWSGVDPSSILYLDTETTGLATGAGSVAFLVGLGRFNPQGTFTLEQYFIDDFGAEPLLVETLDALLAAAGGLVTYNGKTFDVPLLQARWIMQRRRPRFPELHLDLLHYARRLWRLRLPGCGLGEVERGILGLRRLSDMPGHMIPGIYLESLRGIHPERLVPVFDHHAQDIASMGALVALFSKAVREPDHPAFAHVSDQWGLARLMEIRGERDAALLRLEAALLAARDADLEFRLAMHLARTYKRRGRANDAVAIWQARASHCRPDRLDPLIELAKHAEHALKDFDQARQWTEQAIAILIAHSERAAYGVGMNSNFSEKKAELERRLERTAKKLGKEKHNL